MQQTRFLIFDGVDEVGKSTFIRQVQQAAPSGSVVELKYPKILPLSGDLLRINDEKSFELLFATFEFLDQSKTYILDRFIVSNLVYDKVLRGEITSMSKHYWDEFNDRFNVKQILLTRPEIVNDFEDDKISIPKDVFNACIREYSIHGKNHMLVKRDEHGKITGVDQDIRQKLLTKSLHFINKGY